MPIQFVFGLPIADDPGNDRQTKGYLESDVEILKHMKIMNDKNEYTPDLHTINQEVRDLLVWMKVSGEPPFPPLLIKILCADYKRLEASVGSVGLPGKPRTGQHESMEKIKAILKQGGITDMNKCAPSGEYKPLANPPPAPVAATAISGTALVTPVTPVTASGAPCPPVAGQGCVMNCNCSNDKEIMAMLQIIQSMLQNPTTKKPLSDTDIRAAVAAMTASLDSLGRAIDEINAVDPEQKDYSPAIIELKALIQGLPTSTSQEVQALIVGPLARAIAALRTLIDDKHEVVMRKLSEIEGSLGINASGVTVHQKLDRIMGAPRSGSLSISTISPGPGSGTETAGSDSPPGTGTPASGSPPASVIGTPASASPPASVSGRGATNGLSGRASVNDEENDVVRGTDTEAGGEAVAGVEADARPVSGTAVVPETAAVKPAVPVKPVVSETPVAERARARAVGSSGLVGSSGAPGNSNTNERGENNNDSLSIISNLSNSDGFLADGTSTTRGNREAISPVVPRAYAELPGSPGLPSVASTTSSNNRHNYFTPTSTFRGAVPVADAVRGSNTWDELSHSNSNQLISPGSMISPVTGEARSPNVPVQRTISGFSQGGSMGFAPTRIRGSRKTNKPIPTYTTSLANLMNRYRGGPAGVTRRQGRRPLLTLPNDRSDQSSLIRGFRQPSYRPRSFDRQPSPARREEQNVLNASQAFGATVHAEGESAPETQGGAGAGGAGAGDVSVSATAPLVAAPIEGATSSELGQKQRQRLILPNDNTSFGSSAKKLQRQGSFKKTDVSQSTPARGSRDKDIPTLHTSVQNLLNGTGLAAPLPSVPSVPSVPSLSSVSSATAPLAPSVTSATSVTAHRPRPMEPLLFPEPPPGALRQPSGRYLQKSPTNNAYKGLSAVKRGIKMFSKKGKGKRKISRKTRKNRK